MSEIILLVYNYLTEVLLNLFSWWLWFYFYLIKTYFHSLKPKASRMQDLSTVKYCKLQSPFFSTISHGVMYAIEKYSSFQTHYVNSIASIIHSYIQLSLHKLGEIKFMFALQVPEWRCFRNQASTTTCPAMAVSTGPSLTLFHLKWGIWLTITGK